LVVLCAALIFQNNSAARAGDPVWDSRACEVFPISDSSEKAQKGEESKEIEEELKHLLEALKRLEKKARKKVKKEFLPLIREEMERLRKWLKEFPSSEEEPQKIPI